MQIGVVTTYDECRDEQILSKVRALAMELAKHPDVIVLTGGACGGLLRYFVEQYVKYGGFVVSILPIEVENLPPNHPWYDSVSTVRIWTGLSFSARSAVLVRSCDSIIALAGGAGTLTEICMAYGLGKPIVVLEGTGFVADRLKTMFPNGYIDHRRLSRLVFTPDPKEAAELAIELGKRFRGKIEVRP